MTDLSISNQMRFAIDTPSRLVQKIDPNSSNIQKNISDTKNAEPFPEVIIKNQDIKKDKTQTEYSKNIEKLKKENQNPASLERPSDTHTKIAAYQIQQNAFPLHAHLEETQDAYNVRILIPENEQKNIQVSLTENQLVIFGKKQQNFEFQELHHKQSSSVYQSFSETFPIDAPVVNQLLSRKYEGNTLTIHLPKKYPSA